MEIQSTFRDMVIQSFLKWGEFWRYLPISFLGYWILFKISKGIWDTWDPPSRTSIKEQTMYICRPRRLYGNTVNSEIFARILFSRIALKHIFATLKIRDKGVIYLYQ